MARSKLSTQLREQGEKVLRKCRKRPFTTHTDRPRPHFEGGRLPAAGDHHGRSDGNGADSNEILADGSRRIAEHVNYERIIISADGMLNGVPARRPR